MTPADFFIEEDRPRIQAAIERAIQEGSVTVEGTLLAKDGTRFCFEMSGSLLRDSEGRPLAICGLGRDISERKEAQRQILELSRIPDESPDPVLRVSEQGVVLYGNRAADVLLEQWRSDVGQPLPEGLCEKVVGARLERIRQNVRISRFRKHDDVDRPDAL